MDTWALLKKELDHHGINLINNTKCQITDNSGDIKIQGVIKTIRMLNGYIKKQKKLLLSLWNDTIRNLEEYTITPEIVDDKMVDLFIFSLKDFARYLLCFENTEKSKYNVAISLALTRDVQSFSKEQVYTTPDYKISIDWISRNISRLLYICNLLSFASMGKKRVSQYDVKTAKGISGPFAHLDLPMRERTFPFGFGLKERTKGRQKQRRYYQGLMNYNNAGEVGEGYYWREVKNEPFDWMDRDWDDPYPSRHLLSRT